MCNRMLLKNTKIAENHNGKTIDSLSKNNKTKKINESTSKGSTKNKHVRMWRPPMPLSYEVCFCDKISPF